MNKTLIAILVIIVIAVAAYFIWNNAQAPVAMQDPAQETGAQGNQNSNMPVPSDEGMVDDGVVIDVGGEMVADEPVVKEPVVVTYTENGYSPSSVTIKKGQAVRFVNNSDGEETWPASAIHPTHGIYPQKSSTDCLGSSFDSCRGIKTGDSWEFTFTIAGTWRYHDHLHASKTGTIIVQ